MATRTKKQKEDSFESSMESLEQILEELEFATLPLSQLVDQYAKAKEHIQICRKHLDAAELKISLIDDKGSSELFNLEQ